MANHNSEASTRRIDDKILQPGVPGRQRDLAQFQRQCENDGAQRQRPQMSGISEPEHQTGQAEGGEMLQIVLKSTNRTFIRRNDGYDHQANNDKPARRFENFFYHQITEFRAIIA